jgi:hypothetical protein
LRSEIRRWIMKLISLAGSPKQLAEKGYAIYKQKYRQEYEQLYPSQFVAIDLSTEKAYVADTPEGAVKLLQKGNPQSLFHVIKVGTQEAFRAA